jgi:hypothetical protein
MTCVNSFERTGEIHRPRSRSSERTETEPLGDHKTVTRLPHRSRDAIRLYERKPGVANAAGQISLNGGSDNTVASLSLPAGRRYVVTAAVALGNSAAVQNFVSCSLRDDGTDVSTGVASLAALAVFSQTVTLTGAIDSIRTAGEVVVQMVAQAKELLARYS